MGAGPPQASNPPTRHARRTERHRPHRRHRQSVATVAAQSAGAIGGRSTLLATVHAWPAGGRLLDRGHHVEDVVAEVAGRPGWIAGPDRPGHVQDADAPPEPRAVGRDRRHVLVVDRPEEADIPAEEIRVGDLHRLRRSGHLDETASHRQFEAEDHRRRRSPLELGKGRDMGRDLDREGRAGMRSLLDDPDVARPGPKSGDAGDRAEQLDQRRQVVRPEVEQRPGAGGVQEGRIRVPQVRARVLHDRQGGQRGPDLAALDEPSGGLDTRPEDRVRRDAHDDAGGRGRLEQRPTGRPIRGDRLLAPDVLAGRDGLEADRDMGRRDREVHDDLDVIAGEQLRRRAGEADPVGRCLRRGARRVQVGQPHDPQVREAAHRREVLVRDVAAAHDADADRSAPCRHGSPVRNATLSSQRVEHVAVE